MVVRRISNDELYHHGVEGQKWGVQHGPPYPLDSKKEFKNAKKYGKKMFNRSEKLASHSKAIQQVAQAHDFKTSSNTYKNAIDNHNKYVESYAKKHKKEIEKAAMDEIRKQNKKYGWGYSERDIREGIYENTHSSNGFGSNSEFDNQMYKKLKNDPTFKKLSKESADASKQYKDTTMKYAEKILGDYKDVEIKYDAFDKTKAKHVVAEAISYIDSNDLFDYYGDSIDWTNDDWKYKSTR